MPRISGDNLADHVAHQEAAVFDAAIRLFCERGYAQVNMGDIATAVGLARNSLYRYFPDKAHILVRWFRTELPLQADRSRAMLQGPEPPGQRIQRWALDQLDYAQQPEHGLIAALTDVAPDLDDATRAELANSHQQLLAPLAETIREAGIDDPTDQSAISDLIGGLVLAAGRREAGLGPDPAVRAQIPKAIDALLGPGASTPKA